MAKRRVWISLLEVRHIPGGNSEKIHGGEGAFVTGLVEAASAKEPRTAILTTKHTKGREEIGHGCTRIDTDGSARATSEVLGELGVLAVDPGEAPADHTDRRRCQAATTASPPTINHYPSTMRDGAPPAKPPAMEMNGLNHLASLARTEQSVVLDCFLAWHDPRSRSSARSASFDKWATNAPAARRS